jgi:hypothetical protein
MIKDAASGEPQTLQPNALLARPIIGGSAHLMQEYTEFWVWFAGDFS